jgi:hypothetical protein
MRAIAGQYLVTEVAPDTYARTPWAKAFTEDPSFTGVYGSLFHELTSPVLRTLPAFLKKTHFRNPTDVNDCNLQFSTGQRGNLFQFIGSDPVLASEFNDAMECHSRYNTTAWVDTYPTETIIAAAKARPTQTSPLIVDVGGGKGYDLKMFLAKHPGEVPAGSLVLQDLPEALKSVKAELASEQAITVRAHDFFTPQPESVRGARVYMLPNVLHDWPDDKARQILQGLMPVMEKGYSRVLIHEKVVSSEKPASRVTIMDITMMAHLAAAERTEEQWHELVESAGLRVVKIWHSVQAIDSIIEAELA